MYFPKRCLSVFSTFGLLLGMSLAVRAEDFKDQDFSNIQFRYNFSWKAVHHRDPKSAKSRKDLQPIIDSLVELSQKKRSARFDYLLGTALLESGQYNSAIEQITKSLTAKGDYASESDLIDLYRTRGISHKALKKFEKAEEDFSTVLDLNSDDTRALEFRGIVRSDRGNYSDALADFENLVHVYRVKGQTVGQPGAINGAFLGAARMKIEIGRTDEGDKDVLMLANSNINGFHVNPKLLVEVTTRQISKEPKNAALYKLRANNYFLAKEPLKRIDDLSKVIEFAKTDKDRRWAYLSRAREYSDKKQYSRVIQNLTDALEIEKAPQELYFRATMYAHTDELERAIADMNEAIALLSNDDIWFLPYREDLASYLYQAGRLNESLAELNDVIRAKPEKASALLKRAVVYVELGQDDSAKQDLEVLRRIDAQHFRKYAKKEIDAAVARRRASDTKGSYDRQNGEAAWRLGSLITKAAFLRVDGKTQSSSEVFAAAEDCAQTLKINLKPMPVTNASYQENFFAAVNYLKNERKRLSAAIAQKHDPQVGRTCSLAITIRTLGKVYPKNNKKFNEMLAKGIQREGPLSGIPGSIWKPLTEHVLKDAGKNVINDDINSLTSAVLAWLQSESK